MNGNIMQIIQSSADLAVVSGGDTLCSTDTMTCVVEPSTFDDVYIDGNLWWGVSSDDLNSMGFTFDDYYGWY